MGARYGLVNSLKKSAGVSVNGKITYNKYYCYNNDIFLYVYITVSAPIIFQSSISQLQNQISKHIDRLYFLYHPQRLIIQWTIRKHHKVALSFQGVSVLRGVNKLTLSVCSPHYSHMKMRPCSSVSL